MLKNYTSTHAAIANLTAAQKKKYKKFDNTHYLKQLNHFHEMQEAREKSVAYRRHMLNRQKIANYRNEIDRIDGVLSQTVLKHASHQHLKNRKQELGEMIKNIN